MPKHGNFEASSSAPAKSRWSGLAIALLVAALGAFIALLTFILVSGKGPLPFDEAVLNAVLGIRGKTLTELADWITMIAMPPAWIAVAIALSVYAKGPRPFLALVGCGAMGWACNQVLKHLVMRPRPPEELRLAVETSSSFPSGHSITAVAIYGFLVWMVLRYQSRGAWRNTLVVLGIALIVLIGLTRIYLGVHWTSDVLAGGSLGLAWLVLYTRLIAPRILADDVE